MEFMMFAYLAIVFLLGVLVFLYLNPRYFSHGTKEGFTTIALNQSDFPSCVARDMEAQNLLARLAASVKGRGTSDGAVMAYQEFSLIVQKLLCMDADITGMGAGVYASLRLPFNTQHDMEQVGTFVGRCLKNAVKERDISLTLGKLQDRGTFLLGQLCATSQSKAEALTVFDGIVKRTEYNITKVCLKEHASMDIPAGVRDPGYYMPDALKELGPYQNTAAKYHFN